MSSMVVAIHTSSTALVSGRGKVYWHDVGGVGWVGLGWVGLGERDRDKGHVWPWNPTSPRRRAFHPYHHRFQKHIFDRLLSLARI